MEDPSVQHIEMDEEEEAGEEPCISIDDDMDLTSGDEEENR